MLLRRPSPGSFALVPLVALGLLGACSGSSTPQDEADDGLSSLGTSLDGGQTETVGMEGMESSEAEAETDAGSPCSDDDQCSAGQVCGQASGECVPEGGCVLDGDCPAGQTCEGSTCMIGSDCGGFVFSIEAIPPNLLIMLDRSGSMEASVSGSDGNRWEVAKQAIELLTTSFDEKIRFGLATYSACVGDGCSPGTTVVPIADQNAAAINAFLAMTVGQGSSNGAAVNGEGKIEYLCDSGDPETSTGASLQAQVGSMPLQDPERDNAIMLITDGAESGQCVFNGINGPTAAANLLAQAIPVKTFAIGFGGANLTEINAIAQAGGTEVGYLADMADELEDALEQIANAVATCTFELDQIPPDASEIYVFFDKDPAGVPNDPNNGWTYDPVSNTVTFHGAACEAIKGGIVVDIDIVYGCNEPPIG
ncbi:MAG: VWA domain-containing protein [Enhygromyxa sp.]